MPIFFLVTKLTRGVPAVLLWLAAAALEIAPIETGSVIVDEFASRFVSTVELVGLAVTLKSTPVTVTVVDAVDEVVVEVPVTVIAALPVCGPALTVRVTF